MHGAVTVAGTGLGEGMASGDDEGIRPVVMVVHEAAAGGAADEFGGGVAGGAGFGPFLAVAKSPGRVGPAVAAQADAFGFGKIIEKQPIQRHVFGGGRDVPR